MKTRKVKPKPNRQCKTSYQLNGDAAVVCQNNNNLVLYLLKNKNKRISVFFHAKLFDGGKYGKLLSLAEIAN